MTTTGNIEKALGAWLAEHGLGTWSPNANYRASDPWPIFIGVFPTSQAITHCILVNKYADSRDDDTMHDDESPHVYLQFRIRGDRNPFTSEEKADELFQLLHNNTGIALANAPRILLSRRVVTSPRETDANGRFHNIDSYRFTLNPN
ncbi:hypothetical protein HW450_06775 [Corynebacterium hindlerae]|uniref:DUF3168 domain-containing protein n=1 Tax=Corynebacterium hindlerae TaxID=699041 RepID=A0A7G5FBV3_9CORY|nr:minor capsid protein [Corynebacterium hindlerae]QMV84094.1 hypothetical protein HW450_06775 [Corynebacterium hindlerae]